MLIHQYQTRGGRYRMDVYRRDNGLFDIRHFTNNRLSGGALNYEEPDMIQYVRDTVFYAAKIDGINYKKVL